MRDAVRRVVDDVVEVDEGEEVFPHDVEVAFGSAFQGLEVAVTNLLPAKEQIRVLFWPSRAAEQSERTGGGTANWVAPLHVQKVWLNCLALQEAPCHAKRTKGSAEQHYRCATVRNTTGSTVRRE